MLINSPNISGSLRVTGNSVISGSLTVLGSITGAITGSATTASYVEYTNVANKPALVSSSAQVAGFGYATTGSNTFQASQTITGSLFITQNLIVAGSSSIQYISSSVLDIADNTITVNTFNPSVRFGGLGVIDSGSSPQVSGSILFDSVKDQWIFVHQNPTVVTSSIVLMGPETYNDLGNESYISANRLPKGSGIEHLRDSNITDTGTVVSINSNTQVTGSLRVSSTGNFSGTLTGNSSVFTNILVNALGEGVNIVGVTGNPAYYATDQSVNNGGKRWRVGHTGAIGGFSSFDFYNQTDNITALTLASTGAATFSSNVTIQGGNSLFVNNASNTRSGYLKTSAEGTELSSFAGAGEPLILIAPDSTAAMRFYTGGSTIANERMRITSAGNVGIGTASPYGKLEITGLANNYNTAPAITLTDLVGNANSNRWIVGNIATDFGSFNIASAPTPSSTTWTPRITINRSGNVGIGTASPVDALVISGENKLISFEPAGDASFCGIRWSKNTAGGNVTAASIIGTTEGNFGRRGIAFSTGNFANFTDNAVERMRITSTGRVMIGGSSGTLDPVWQGMSVHGVDGTDKVIIGYLSSATNGATIGSHISGLNNWADLNYAANNHIFRYQQSEVMRITSGGYLKASNNGVYSNVTEPFHELNQSSNGYALTILAHRGTSDPYGLEIAFTGADPNNASNYVFGAYKTSGGFAWIYRIFSNGTVSARSDARWKKNIETTRNGYIDDLCKLRVVKYNWYNHEDGAPKELGLIAQEVEEVFPNLVQHDPVISKREVEQEDGSFVEEEFEDGTSRSIKVSVLPYMLLKAIQELKSENDTLKSRIDTLEQA